MRFQKDGMTPGCYNAVHEGFFFGLHIKTVDTIALHVKVSM